MLDFIDTQHKQVIQTESSLALMKKEQERLKPIIESNNRVIEAIFTEQEIRNQKIQTRQLWIGIVIGTGTSLIGTFLFTMITYLMQKAKISKN